VITADRAWGRTDGLEIATDRGYIVADFYRTDLDPDDDDRTNGVHPRYPDYDWATLSVWAWGFSRVVDYLATLDYVDKDKIVATGHSRGGKTALLAGAMDDRIAVVVPNGSGAGGCGSFKYMQGGAESLLVITRDDRFHYWFQPRLGDFRRKVDRLPFDQHFLKALVAPRPLLCTDALHDEWANPWGSQQTTEAAREIYTFLGVPDKVGHHYRQGGHDHNIEDWEALLDFADFNFFDKPLPDDFYNENFARADSLTNWKSPDPLATTKADFVAGDLVYFTGKPGSPNGAWCWFQDERAIVDDEHPDEPVLMLTSISASRDIEAEQGDLDFHWYGLASGNGGTIEFHDRLGQDDHNVAALFQLEDGRTLAAYARHNKDVLTYKRLSAPHRPDAWESAEVFEGEAKSTYNNLLTAGGPDGRRLLNFSRLQGWDPNFLVYDEQAGKFEYGGRLLNSDGRPYLKYANSADGARIHVVATDQHPRNFDNSIYHGVTDGIALFDSAGETVDPDLSDQDAAEPTDLTVVFEGDPDNVAWMADVETDRNDQPVIAFSVQRDGRDLPQGSGGLDHRYHIAWQAPEGWRHREIAYAGERLYPREDDYTGLVAIDPEDVNYLVISTNADPLTGAPLISRADGRRHYELFAGRWNDDGEPVAWRALTRDSTVDNIRPIIPAWDSDRRIVLWMRGIYTTYTDFDTQIVGTIQSRP
jgi:hypothetical protein